MLLGDVNLDAAIRAVKILKFESLASKSHFFAANQRLDYVKDSGNLITKSKTHDIEIFRINGEGLFLASANQGRDKNMDSTIYKWDDRSQVFTSFQNISTNVARDWEYFSIENEVGDCSCYACFGAEVGHALKRGQQRFSLRDFKMYTVHLLRVFVKGFRKLGFG